MGKECDSMTDNQRKLLEFNKVLNYVYLKIVF